MSADREEWAPGSFTKNFSWGKETPGLQQLHRSIRIGFAGLVEDVRRDIFRERLQAARLIDYVPANFFLFNEIRDGENYLIADELVFQAIHRPHSSRFDQLALFAFLFSYAGRWKGAQSTQRRPALWAYHYIRDRVATAYAWDTSRINADDIQDFLRSSPQYKAATSRKVSTNLNYILKKGGVKSFPKGSLEQWWVNSLFLALDRILGDAALDGAVIDEKDYSHALHRANFAAISGGNSIEKQLAIRHLVSLYSACGGRSRFDERLVLEHQALRLPEVQWLLSEDTRPHGAVHPTNPGILKSIPRACAMLARYSGFETLTPDELENFDPEDFVRRHVRTALQRLDNIRPSMSPEELMRLTRE